MDRPGTTFAGYDVRRVVVQTALLSMYEATSPNGHRVDGASSVGRPVSLWVSEPFDSSAAEAVDECMRRAGRSASVHHPGLVEVIDVGRAHGRVYFVTPLVDALTLGELVRRDGPLSPDDAVALLTEVAHGLDTAHDAGMVHGAISPSAIWVERSDGPARACLIGFGLEALLRARVRADHRDRLLDDVLYIAPEQLRGDAGAGERADQYALACALYHCVAGHPPFVRDRTSALFGAHLLGRPESLINADRIYADAVSAGMAKEPDERFDSCMALLEAAAGGPVARTAPVPTAPAPIVAVRYETPAPAPAPSVPERAAEPEPLPPEAAAPAPAHPAPARRRRRRRGEIGPWVAVGLIVLAIVAGSVGALVMLDGDPSAEQAAPEEPAVRRQPVAATAAAQGDPDAGVVAWQRRIGDEPVAHLAISGVNAVAATGNNLTVVNPLTGSRRWRKVADFGVLTDLVALGDVLVYRTDVLSAVSMPFGIQLWENGRDETPTGALTTGHGNVYAVGPGEVFPEAVAVDPASGEERWHFHGQQIKVESDAAVAAAGELLVVLQRGSLFGIDPGAELVSSGTELGRVEIADEVWRVDVGGPWPESLAATEVEAVFAQVDGDVCSYRLEDGEQRWCEQISSARDVAPALVLAGETVVVVTREKVVALDLASGEARWEAEATDPFVPVIAVDAGMVTVANNAGTVRTFAVRDGEEQWRVDDLGRVTVLAGGDGGVLVGSEDGLLMRLEPPGSAGS